MKTRLTPHQQWVLNLIAMQTRRHDWAYSINVGCRGACQHLRAKGMIREEEVRGPLGGTTYRYQLTELGRLKVAT